MRFNELCQKVHRLHWLFGLQDGLFDTFRVAMWSGDDCLCQT